MVLNIQNVFDIVEDENDVDLRNLNHIEANLRDDNQHVMIVDEVLLDDVMIVFVIDVMNYYVV